MKIHELFELVVTRDIPPVVYFHEQSPERLESEVKEYIITGGYPAGDPRTRRLAEGQGIHEQFVRLLQGVRSEITDKPGGPELPGVWISGFFGSGKSSFAKLLGYALDGRRLPDGTLLADALLRRDDSQRAHELHEAWRALREQVNPLAVVFDIGGVARDEEHIHAAVVRQLQRRLGYCATSSVVAEHELKLQLDGEWKEFQLAAKRTLGRPWDEVKDSQQADDHFSHVLHVLHPDRYTDPMSWIDSRAGQRTGAGTSVEEAVAAIAAMRKERAPDRTLFFVVDEVSQYVLQQEQRVLKLQSFVSELGQRLRGKAWLLATGQQKLDSDASVATVIGKLKDRFPERLRVHLAPTNIRDVVHRRLLKKKKSEEQVLRELFRRHRSDLKRFGYGCDSITEDDFVEVYPLLPGHIDLLLEITTALRGRSTRMKGDDHTIRGLLQLLGELFRSQRLAEREVGHLVTLDAIFEVQQSALDQDIQTSMARVFEHLGDRDGLAARAAKAVALLELIQETQPTTAELVASCLHDTVDREGQVDAVTAALEALRAAGLIGYSEKHGYKIQSSAGQEWQRDRDAINAPPEKQSELIQEQLNLLLGDVERPKLKGRPFSWGAYYGDSRGSDVRVGKTPADDAVVVDFRYVGAEARRSEEWVRKSNEGSLVDRVLWIVGDPGQVDYLAKELFRSRRMVNLHASRRESLSRPKQRLLLEEEARTEDLESRLKEEVARAFFHGALIFRGRSVAPRDLGGAFATALQVMGNRVLPDLYPHFTEVSVTPAELKQLLEATLSGPSSKFLEGGLGILSLDAGKYVPTCAGPVPSRILQVIEGHGSMQGQILLSTFARPPYGYPADVVKACLAGLLRGAKIRIRPDSGREVTFVTDEGVRDLFRLDRDLGRATILAGGGTAVGPRDRAAICRFFKDAFGVELDRENHLIADAVYAHLLPRRRDLREVEARLLRLPDRRPLPEPLTQLGRALDECSRSRDVEPTVMAVRDQLDALRDGFQLLGRLRGELADEAIDAVTRAARIRDGELAQLEALEDEAEEVRGPGARVREQLAIEHPWRGIVAIEPDLERIRAAYVRSRRALLGQQERRAEEVRAAVRSRPGFERLKGDAAHHVLRPITEALYDTTEDALNPPLPDMRERFAGRLSKAEHEANDRLDTRLAADEKKPTPVVKVQANLSGREIATREQLEAMLRELTARIGPLLDQGKRVRIV